MSATSVPGDGKFGGAGSILGVQQNGVQNEALGGVVGLGGNLGVALRPVVPKVWVGAQMQDVQFGEDGNLALLTWRTEEEKTPEVVAVKIAAEINAALWAGDVREAWSGIS